MKNEKIKMITTLGILTAIVVVLQIVANYIQPIPGVSLSFVLVPIVIGAALAGPLAGGYLGLVFGAVVLLTGGANAFLAINVPGTIIVCLVKGFLAGFFAGLVYKLFSKSNQYLAVFFAAIICPVTNTGIFLLGCRLFFWDTIVEWGTMSGFKSPIVYAFLGLAGINFIIELAINFILAPIILRLINLWKERRTV